jgi:S1-C subfamily serine protease
MGRLPGTADASPSGSGETVDNAQVRGPGFTAGNISPEVAAELGVADGSGVVVLSVAPRSEAARNGLLERDVIVQAGTIEVRGTADLERGLAQRGPGEMLLLRVRRGEALVFVSFFP